MKNYDMAIIGFGKGGKTLAAAMGNAGKKVALIERSGQMYGGTCINVGCIPSKSLVHSSGYAVKSRTDKSSYADKALFYKEAIAEKRRLTAALRQKNFDKLNNNENVTVLTGTASFLDAHRLEVETADGKLELSADTIAVNTGAAPFVPPIPGLKESSHMYLSETMLDLETLPARLVIIGGGYIGMEFASIYTNFGSEVTVIQDGDVFLPREDAEIASTVLDSLTERGIKVLRSAKILSVEDVEEAEDSSSCKACDTAGKSGYSIVTAEQDGVIIKLPADAILTATGRRPNLTDLHVEKAGIELTNRGAIKTDEHLRTSVPHIFAMGDVVGGLQFTYISLDDFRIVKSLLTGDGARTTQNRGAVPYSVFLDPPFSRVGLSEKEAKEMGYSVKIAKLPAAAIPKALVLKKPTGLLKAVIDADNGHLLGAHFFCEESHEMINLVKLAMDAGLSYTVLRDMIYTHPTMNEALNDLFATLTS